VNARLLVEQKQNVTLLANSAIQRNSQGTYVWLVNPDQTVAVRPITVGTTEGDQSEITPAWRRATRWSPWAWIAWKKAAR
jgi:multidrug efflux system membrane fusion protein